MTKRRTYVARYERDEDNYWSVVVVVDAKRSAISDGQTLPKARRRIRQSVAALLAVREDSFEIEDEIVLPTDAQRAIEGYVAAQAAAQAQLRELDEAQKRAARALVKHGLSRRDTGDVLGISGQRVQQVLSA